VRPRLPSITLPYVIAAEWVIQRRAGELQGPYRNEVDVRRDYDGLKGAALYRRRVIRPRNYRLLEAKEWDEA
jgi:hypothetical protein